MSHQRDFERTRFHMFFAFRNDVFKIAAFFTASCEGNDAIGAELVTARHDGHKNAVARGKCWNDLEVVFKLSFVEFIVKIQSGIQFFEQVRNFCHFFNAKGQIHFGHHIQNVVPTFLCFLSGGFSNHASGDGDFHAWLAFVKLCKDFAQSINTVFCLLFDAARV